MHLVWASWVFMVVRDGAVSSKDVFGKALKFPFQAVEKHRPGGCIGNDTEKLG